MAKVTIAAANPVRPAPGSALAAEGFSGTLNAPTDSWEIANNGRIYLRVRNDHASQTGTLTIKTPQTVDGNAVADRTHTLAASRTSVLFGPFPSARRRCSPHAERDRLALQLAAGCCPASGGEAVRGVLCAGSGVGAVRAAFSADCGGSARGAEAAPAGR